MYSYVQNIEKEFLIQTEWCDKMELFCAVTNLLF